MNRLVKDEISDLAVSGGNPAFDHPVHVGCPNIGDRKRLLERINRILDAKWLTNDGENLLELERRIAEVIGVKHCVATCNGTVGLQLAAAALEMSGEVIVPSMTFVATAHVLQWRGITPVFCDISRATHNLDPGRVEELISPRTTGIIGVHLWGRPCDVERLSEIAKSRGLKLLYDAAHAFGCSYGGKMIGGFGDAEVFSFHATKFFNTLEGGAVVTNNEDVAAKIRLMRNFGFAGYDKVVSLGVNGKMNEMSAAMGLTGLDSLDDFIGVNYRNYKQYKRELEGVPGIRLIEYNEEENCNYQYVVLELDPETTRISRDQLVGVLHAENVLARRYFYPGCHKMEPYRSLFPDAGATLPETERLADRVVSLPTGTAVGSSDVGVICNLIRLIVTNGERVGVAFDAFHRGAR